MNHTIFLYFLIILVTFTVSVTVIQGSPMSSFKSSEEHFPVQGPNFGKVKRGGSLLPSSQNDSSSFRSLNNTESGSMSMTSKTKGNSKDGGSSSKSPGDSTQVKTVSNTTTNTTYLSKSRAAKRSIEENISNNDDLEQFKINETFNVSSTESSTNKGGSNGDDQLNQFESAVQKTVESVLNKIATAIKNATDPNQAQPAPDPCDSIQMKNGSQGRSGGSRSNNGLNCTQEYDPLEEFFPPDPAWNKEIKPKISRRRAPAQKDHYLSSDFDSDHDHQEPQSHHGHDHINASEGQGQGSPFHNQNHDHSDETHGLIHNRNHKVETTTPTLVNDTSSWTPKEIPGKCPTLTASGSNGHLVPNIPGRDTGEGNPCISLSPDSSQCSKDVECPGTKKCCFFGCPPYSEVGICEVPIFF